MINVPRHVATFGGQVQYGWIIWSDPRIYIEAEFHTVWRTPLGELIDITPTVSGEDQILFLPDNKIVYEHKLVKNIIKPLVDTPEIRAMIKGAELRFRIKSKHFKDDRVDIKA
jgi:hypothetical protein